MLMTHYAPNRCEPSIEVIVKMRFRPEGGRMVGSELGEHPVGVDGGVWSG